MKMERVNESAYRLESWTKTLLVNIQKGLPQIRAVLDGTSQVPNGTSKQSWSSAMLGDMERAVKEVQVASADLRKAIWED